MNTFVVADVAFTALVTPTCVALWRIGRKLGWPFLRVHAVFLAGMACAPLAADVVGHSLGWWRVLPAGLLVADAAVAWWQARRRARREGLR